MSIKHIEEHNLIALNRSCIKFKFETAYDLQAYYDENSTDVSLFIESFQILISERLNFKKDLEKLISKYLIEEANHEC